MDPKLRGAIDALCDALRTDDEYAYGWQANIAMTMADTLRRHGIDHPELNRACNKGAKNFLWLLTYVAEVNNGKAAD